MYILNKAAMQIIVRMQLSTTYAFGKGFMRTRARTPVAVESPVDNTAKSPSMASKNGRAKSASDEP